MSRSDLLQQVSIVFVRRRPRSTWTVHFAARAAAAVITWSYATAAAAAAAASFQADLFRLSTSRNQQRHTCREMSTLVETHEDSGRNFFGSFLKASPLVESDVRLDQSVLVSFDKYDGNDDVDQGFADVAYFEYPTSKGKKIQFKGFSTTSYRGSYRRPDDARPGRSMSSTMPGFGVESDLQRAQRKARRLAELASGRKIVDTPMAQSQRKRTHASVPDSLVHFANEILREKRITRKEEIELGELTQEAVRLQRLYDKLKDKLHREPTDDEWCAAAGKINMMALEKDIVAGVEAKNRLVTSNLRLVQSVVNTYIRNGLPAHYNAGDMMQEGTMALIRAAEKFEPNRGWMFSTYAMYWVRASVKRNHVVQSRPAIPVPRRFHQYYKRLLRQRRLMEIRTKRQPTMKELGDAVGMSESQVERCIKAMQQKFFSLDQVIHNIHKAFDDGSQQNRLVEILESKTADQEYSLDSELLREALIETLHRHLNKEQVELLLLRYGLKACPGHKPKSGQPTIAELSSILGYKQEKVRRIINQALKHLRTVNPEEWRVFQRELC